jgi:hypothetical protein
LKERRVEVTGRQGGKLQQLLDNLKEREDIVNGKMKL